MNDPIIEIEGGAISVTCKECEDFKLIVLPERGGYVEYEINAFRIQHRLCVRPVETLVIPPKMRNWYGMK